MLRHLIIMQFPIRSKVKRIISLSVHQIEVYIFILFYTKIHFFSMDMIFFVPILHKIKIGAN